MHTVSSHAPLLTVVIVFEFVPYVNYEKMSITKSGNPYSTTADAAKELGGVSTKTVRDWIKKGIIDEPPLIEYGLRTVRHFPPEYIKKAIRQLSHYRERKTLGRR